MVISSLFGFQIGGATYRRNQTTGIQTSGLKSCGV